MSEDSTRKPGRPRVDKPRVNMAAWVLADTYDRVVRRANARNTSVSGYVREVIEKHVEPRKRS